MIEINPKLAQKVLYINGGQVLVFCTPAQVGGVGGTPPTSGDYYRRKTKASALKIHIVYLGDNKI